MTRTLKAASAERLEKDIRRALEKTKNRRVQRELREKVGGTPLGRALAAKYTSCAPDRVW